MYGLDSKHSCRWWSRVNQNTACVCLTAMLRHIAGLDLDCVVLAIMEVHVSEGVVSSCTMELKKKKKKCELVIGSL